MIQRRFTITLLILYALLTVYSILNLPLWIASSILLTLVGFAFAILHAGQREGWANALRLLAIVFGVSLLFESVGVATGWIYGPYHYTDKLGPKFLGLVPFMIPVAWFMMSYLSFIIADWLVPAWKKRWTRLLMVAAIAGLVMTAWDLVMDPVMVAGGHWVWDVQGAYYGIPLQNFLGWWLTVFTTYILYQLVRRQASVEPRQALDRMAIPGYLVTAVGIIAGSLLHAAGDLALIGFFAMLPWPLMALLRLSTEPRAG
jgi:uncharacterized membrane protein